MKSITIESLNYVSMYTGRKNYNYQVIYSQNGKSYTANIFICLTTESFYFPRQPKECEILEGLNEALKQYNNLFIDKIV